MPLIANVLLTGAWLCRLISFVSAILHVLLLVGATDRVAGQERVGTVLRL